MSLFAPKPPFSRPDVTQRAPLEPFETAEFQARVADAQRAMEGAGLAALLLTTEPEFRYFTGFLTRFWESPSRPWFLILPLTGPPVAVIPQIGAHLMGQTWIDDIRTWPAPDPRDEDGIGLLSSVLAEVVPAQGQIGVPSGPESHLRLPLTSWARLGAGIGRRRLRDDAGICTALRMVKSKAEIARIQAACASAGRAFARVPDIAGMGQPLSQVFRQFQMLALDEGADWVPYLAGAAAAGGYGDVISPADDRPLRRGDVLMLDTGLVREGYFCDFDRNFSVGPPDATVRAAHERLILATEAGFDAARPGATPADLFAAMTGALGEGTTGRLGHGLGMQLTEPPSLIPSDRTPLAPGMVLTLEPVITLGPERIMVHEENIVIREHGAEWLSPRASSEIPVLS